MDHTELLAAVDKRVDEVREDIRYIKDLLILHTEKTAKTETDVSWLKRVLGGLASIVITVVGYLSAKAIDLFKP